MAVAKAVAAAKTAAEAAKLAAKAAEEAEEESEEEKESEDEEEEVGVDNDENDDDEDYDNDEDTEEAGYAKSVRPSHHLKEVFIATHFKKAGKAGVSGGVCIYFGVSHELNAAFPVFSDVPLTRLKVQLIGRLFVN